MIKMLLQDTWEHKPDYIPHSQEGYVRSEDLSPVPDSLEDAISDSQKAFHTQTIPLYNLSGEVIGEFSLDAMDTTTLKYISENSEKY